MRKILSGTYFMVLIAFIIWGIININIINTKRISGGEYNISNSQYRELYTEIKDNIFGFVTDKSAIRIQKADSGYLIKINNNKYIFNTSGINNFSKKLGETGEILHRGINNIKMSLIGSE